MPDVPAAKTGTAPSKNTSNQTALDRLAEESFAVHMKYGGEFIDENPITGRPGEFHLTSTGRKDKATTLQSGKSATNTPTPNTKAPEDGKKDGKSPKTPTMSKPKRRKSKIGGAPGT